jgi:hypothetical protein
MKKRRNRNKWIFVTTADMKQFYIAAKASARDSQTCQMRGGMNTHNRQLLTWEPMARGSQHWAIHERTRLAMQTKTSALLCRLSFTDACAMSYPNQHQVLQATACCFTAFQRLLCGRSTSGRAA